MTACSEQAAAWLRLSRVRGIGPMLGRKLVENAGSIDQLWCADPRQWQSTEGIGPAVVKALKQQSAEAVDPLLKQCERAGITILCPDDACWPPNLYAIDDAPLILFLKGNSESLLSEKKLAVVGARRASREGVQITRRWCRHLSDQGITIISGMAYGIDAAAHGGALEGLAPTIAVLGCGLNALSEQQQAQVDAIGREGGSVISEYLPDQSARPEQFPRRNRIIASISDATLVVEADIRSGSLITARCAADYGREVFAVPGSVLAGNHEGCHQLIRDGAELISDPASMLQTMGWSGEKLSLSVRKKAFHPGSENEAKIVQILGTESMHLDELSEICGLTLPELSPILLGLELQGVIERLPGSRYQLSAE